MSLYPGGDIAVALREGERCGGGSESRCVEGTGGMCKDLLMQLSIIRLQEGRIDYRCHLSAGAQARNPSGT